MFAGFPLFTQAAHRFPEAHRQRSDSFKSLLAAGGNFAVLFSANLREQQFGVL